MNLDEEFNNFINQESFPCIGAKAALKKNQLHYLIAKDLRLNHDDQAILQHTYDFINRWKSNTQTLQTSIVLFQHPRFLMEVAFEDYLWKRLQSLHELDSQHYKWDSSVHSEVAHKKFSFSLGGHAFFVVGLHSQSSRKARAFAYPSLVFNLHEQFELLKKNGVYGLMRDKIRENDVLFSGSINPMLCDFGESSEALQYSGREVNQSFVCPFKAMIKNEER